MNITHSTVWMWTSEVFSMNVRAQAVGMCSQMQNVANTVFQQFFPIFLANEGLKCLFFFFATNILLATFVFFFIPETKQVSLEEMDALFGGQNHVEKGSQMLAGGGGTTTTGHSASEAEKDVVAHHEDRGASV